MTPEDARTETQRTKLDEVRDILFGERTQALEARLDALERRLLDRIEGLGRDLRRELDGQCGAIRSDLGELTERLRTERETRAEAVAKLGSDMHEQSRKNEQRIAELDERASAAHRELRSSVEATLRAAKEEAQSGLEAWRRDLQTQTSDVERRKVERGEMATVLAELAERLGGRSEPKTNGEMQHPEP